MHFKCLSLKFKCLSLKILYTRRVISGGKSMILFVIFYSWLPAIVFDNVNGTDEEVPSLVKYTIRMDSDRVDSTKKIRNKWVGHLMWQELFCLHSECFRIPNFFVVSYVLYWHCTSQKGHSPLFIVHARSVAFSKPTLDSGIRGAQCFWYSHLFQPSTGLEPLVTPAVFLILVLSDLILLLFILLFV